MPALNSQASYAPHPMDEPSQQYMRAPPSFIHPEQQNMQRFDQFSAPYASRFDTHNVPPQYEQMYAPVPDYNRHNVCCITPIHKAFQSHLAGIR